MFLKTLFSWLLCTAGFLILLLGITMFTTSFFVNALDENKYYKITDQKIDDLIDKLLPQVKEAQFANMSDFQKAQIAEFCKTQIDNPICSDDALKEKMKNQINIKDSEGVKNMMNLIDQLKQSNLMIYGIILFVLGSFIILVGKFFSFIPTLSTISYEGAFASAISAVNFKILPFVLEKMTSMKMAGVGPEKDLGDVVSQAMIEWLKPALEKAFFVSLILLIVFVLLYIVSVILKKSSSENELISG